MKKLITCFMGIFVFIILFFTQNSYALSGNGFIWNKLELTIPQNANFESYLNEFEVRFYYNGALTNEEVKVELDSFYYGSLSIDTSKVCDKEVTLIATVSGYSNYDRRSITLHVRDYEAPTIKCIVDLVFEKGDTIEFDKYFSITDNAGIDEKTIKYDYNENDLSEKGRHNITVSCSDVNGNLAVRVFEYVINENHEIDTSTASRIEIEYNDLNYLEYLKTCIKAVDNYDGDISNTLTVEGLDVKKLGHQDITMTVTNSVGESKTINKEVYVVDLTAPVLELSTYHDTILKDNAMDIDFYSYISKVYDNAGEIYEKDVEIDTSDYTAGIGQNSVYFVLKDSSGNYTKRELVIDIRYDVAPVITVDEASLVFIQGESFNLSDYITVSSDYDPNVLTNYKLDEKVLNRDEPGVYEIIIEAMDYAGNESIKKCYVTIESKDEHGLAKVFNNIYKFIYKYKLIFALGIIGVFAYLVVMINKRRKKLGE